VLIASVMATIVHHEDLAAWRLAVELRKAVFAFTARPEIAKHSSFCDQIRKSSSSAPANLAEGFWRHLPGDNARFVRIALGSLGETETHLGLAKDERYISETEFTDLSKLTRRAIAASIGWHKYLAKCATRKGRRPNARNAKPITDNL
jgi:four helix bundle protein